MKNDKIVEKNCGSVIFCSHDEGYKGHKRNCAV